MKKENIHGLIKAIETTLNSPLSILTKENRQSLEEEKVKLEKEVTKKITPKDIESILQSIFIIMEIIKEAPHIIEIINEISPHLR